MMRLLATQAPIYMLHCLLAIYHVWITNKFTTIYIYILSPPSNLIYMLHKYSESNTRKQPINLIPWFCHFNPRHLHHHLLLPSPSGIGLYFCLGLFRHFFCCTHLLRYNSLSLSNNSNNTPTQHHENILDRIWNFWYFL